MMLVLFNIMKAQDTSLKTILEGVKQFVIPIYQRQYQWNPDKRKQSKMTVEKMWDDIKALKDPDGGASHFFGSIVTYPMISSASQVSRFLVIDGQQRLISVSLLLAAIRDMSTEINFLESPYSHFIENIRDSYLFNPYIDGEEKYRILPTQPDRETYFLILKGKGADEKYNNLSKSYDYFHYQLKKALEECGEPQEKMNYLNDLEITLLNKMKIVDVSLNDQDDPQDVFESLNYAGIPLSNWDLVRNFLLMPYDSSEQDRIYSTLIEPIQNNIKDREDDFLRNYLGMKGSAVITKNIYYQFKDVMEKIQKNEGGQEKELDEMKTLSRFFYLLNNPNEITDLPIKDDIEFATKTLGIAVHFPILMKLLLLHKNGTISDDALVSSIKILNSYLLRRIIKLEGTQGLNKYFPTIVDSIGSEPEKAIREAISKGYYEVPKDLEVFTYLPNYPFGSEAKIKIAKKLLYEIEKTMNKEVPDIDKLQVEHIMPREPEQWKSDLGDDWERIYSTYLDTIGNLTLTGYNQEMQNYPFDKKKNMKNGYKDSSIRITRDLCSRNKWGEKEINERANELINRIIEIWKI